MIGLEIVLIVFGFACVCVSFFVSGKKDLQDAMEGEDGVRASAIWSEKEEQMIRERINTILSERQTELIDSTEEQMSHLCNEKIMAVDEFSQQLLEKIETNHQEVVFMYNMLNEKEKEIKNIMTQPVKKVQQPVMNQETIVPIPEPVKPMAEPVMIMPEMDKSKSGEAKTAIEILAKETAEKKEAKRIAEQKRAMAEAREAVPVADMAAKKSDIPGNVNLQIQKLYRQGKSVLEISKELNVGQGEVKLVIALYGGRK